MTMDALLDLLRTDANAANAFGALASAAAALFALLVSVVALIVSVRAVSIQHRHNRLSVKPLPEIIAADYEDSLSVRIQNNGAGPMIVKNLIVRNGSDKRNSLIEWMPPLPGSRPWNTFTYALKERTILPGQVIKLLELTAHQDEQDFERCRDATRMALCILTIEVIYTDVYDTVFPQYAKALTWFRRNLSEAKTLTQPTHEVHQT